MGEHKHESDRGAAGQAVGARSPCPASLLVK